jgi:hypothetical protein
LNKASNIDKKRDIATIKGDKIEIDWWGKWLIHIVI